MYSSTCRLSLPHWPCTTNCSLFSFMNHKSNELFNAEALEPMSVGVTGTIYTANEEYPRISDYVRVTSIYLYSVYR